MKKGKKLKQQKLQAIQQKDAETSLANQVPSYMLNEAAYLSSIGYK